MQSRGASSSAPSLTAAEAAQLLGVKAQTVYAYASRGLLRRVGLGKRRHYLLEDVERLQARQRARAGHGPVAAAALSFGEAVLDTRISGIDERGPVYRGLPALQLAQEGRSFETVAELLWTGQLPAQPANWKDRPLGGRWGRARTSLDELFAALPLLRSAAPAGTTGVPADGWCGHRPALADGAHFRPRSPGCRAPARRVRSD